MLRNRELLHCTHKPGCLAYPAEVICIRTVSFYQCVSFVCPPVDTRMRVGDALARNAFENITSSSDLLLVHGPDVATVIASLF